MSPPVFMRRSTGLALVVSVIGMVASGCVSTEVVAQPGYWESSPRYQDDFIYRQPQRRGHYQQQQGYYQQPSYDPGQGYNDYGRRERGYYHQPRGRFAPQPHFYDKEAAKDYWRSQKDAQKRAIKRGYYGQPQAFPGGGQGAYGGGGGGGLPFGGGAGATAGRP